MTTEQLAVLIGAVLPLFIAFVKRAHYSNTINGIIALIVYFVVGFAYVVVSGTPLTAANLTTIIGIVTVSGTAAYTLFWSNVEDTPSGT